MTELKQEDVSLKLECCNCGRKFEAVAGLERCCDCQGLLMAIKNDDLVGTTIGGKYRINRLAASGGMGNVYEAFHLHLQTNVALKVLPDSGAITREQLERFQQEARLASMLSHPNIARILDFGVDPRPYLVMDYVNGQSLSKLLSDQKHFSQERLLKICLQIADAMDAAHKAGLIHRDLKPSNVMIEDVSGAVKIIDFGLAKDFVDDVKLTRTGETVGSPPYMSPEQCRGLQLDCRTDIYSLGCLMYEAFTGVAPFAAENMIAAIFKHLETEEPAFKTACPKRTFAKGLETVVKNCLSKEPDERYSSMSALKADLQNVLNNKPGKIHNLRARPGLKGILSKLAMPATVAASVLAFVVVAGIWSMNQPPPLVPNNNRLAVGALARAADSVPIELNAPTVLNGKTRPQIFAIRQAQLDKYRNLLACPYQPAEVIYKEIDFSKPWISDKGLVYTKADGPTFTQGASFESGWLLNPLLLVRAESRTGVDWNKRLIGDPEKVKNFPFLVNPEGLSINPVLQSMDVTYDLDKYAEEVMEVNDWKDPPGLVDQMEVALGHENARDLGYNFMRIEVDGKDNARQTSDLVQLAVTMRASHFCGTMNNHSHPPSGNDIWYLPVKLHAPCVEKVQLYIKKPTSVNEKPDMTCNLNFKYSRDGKLNTLPFLVERKARIIQEEGADSIRLLSIYRRTGDAFLAGKQLKEARDAYGQALVISCRKAESEMNSILSELAEAMPADTSDAQIEETAGRQQWPPYVKNLVRGAFFYIHNNPDMAVVEFDQACKQKPDSANALSWRAYTLHMMGRYREAVADYKKALAIEKQWPGLADNLKECEQKARDKFQVSVGLAHAVVDMTRPLGLSRSFAPPYMRNGLLSFKNGRYGDATSEFKEYIQLEGWNGGDTHPTYASIFGHLSSRFAHDDASAARLLTLAEPHTSSSTWPHPAILFFQGKMSAEKLLALAGKDNDKLTEARCYIGFDLLLKDKIPEGKDYLRQVVATGNKTFMEYEISERMLKKLR